MKLERGRMFVVLVDETPSVRHQCTVDVAEERTQRRYFVCDDQEKTPTLHPSHRGLETIEENISKRITNAYNATELQQLRRPSAGCKGYSTKENLTVRQVDGGF